MKDHGLEMWHREKATKLHQECPVTKDSADELKRAGGLETRCLDSMFYLPLAVISWHCWKKTCWVENNLITIQPDEFLLTFLNHQLIATLLLRD